jgi:hypothetical protein
LAVLGAYESGASNAESARGAGGSRSAEARNFSIARVRLAWAPIAAFLPVRLSGKAAFKQDHLSKIISGKAFCYEYCWTAIEMR